MDIQGNTKLTQGHMVSKWQKWCLNSNSMDLLFISKQKKKLIAEYLPNNFFSLFHGLFISVSLSLSLPPLSFFFSLFLASSSKALFHAGDQRVYIVDNMGFSWAVKKKESKLRNNKEQSTEMNVNDNSE